MLNLSPYDTNYDAEGRVNYNIGAEAFAGRGVAIKWIDIEGPLFDTWPPPSVGRLFGDSRIEPVKQARSDRRPSAFTIAHDDPKSAAEHLLREFASRAFRRPVASDEVKSYVKLVRED